MAVVPVGQVAKQVFPNKFKVLQDVQFVRVAEQVSQSP